MTNWVFPVTGGVLMGIGAGLVLIVNGRAVGVSGLVASLVGVDHRDLPWRAAFVAGLVAGGAALAAVYRPAIPVDTPPLARMVLAGALVGIGARYGGGCTSGHGLLGVGRLSGRSILATIVFMATGMLTIAIARHWLGAAL